MQVFNSLSGKKEGFVPQGDEVKMYVCGINPYDDAHIGHALSYIFFDVVRRYLEYRGYKVKHIQNITDIEDNIIAHANELGVTVQELTQKYVERYDEDMKSLNVQPAHVYPRAMSEIPKMLEIVSGLIDKGFAYAVGGNVYFRVKSVPDYGKLSHRNLDEMMAGARIDPGEEKEHPMDFLLWKEAKPGEPSWDSPWGKGRPGWHIECSAMSIRYLGETIDIHGGGQDVVFPHHENEIAQSESFTGKKPFVKYWIHNGLLSIGGEKGSRSLGNMITIREALKEHTADAIRIFVLGSYYRSPLSFLSDSLDVAERGTERLRLAAAAQVKGVKGPAGIDTDSYRNRFIEVMDDDFGTPQALATLFDMARDINRSNDEGYDVTKAQQVFAELAGVLGLTLSPREPTRYTRTLVTNIATSSRVLAESIDPISVGNNINVLQARDEVITASGNLLAQIDVFLPQDEELVDGVIEIESSINNTVETVKELRQILRENKLYNEADNIRNYYENHAGVQFEDTAQGTTWKLKR